MVHLFCSASVVSTEQMLLFPWGSNVVWASVPVQGIYRVIYPEPSYLSCLLLPARFLLALSIFSFLYSLGVPGNESHDCHELCIGCRTYDNCASCACFGCIQKPDTDVDQWSPFRRLAALAFQTLQPPVSNWQHLA
jgi:hypothetical protein